MAKWRVGEHYAIHIYEGETPVATALTVSYAKQIVADHNAATDDAWPALNKAMTALEIIAGRRQGLSNIMGNRKLAKEAIRAIRSKGRAEL